MPSVQCTIMRGPGNSANTPYPASYVGIVAGSVIATKPYAGNQPGVNTVLKVRSNNSRTLRITDTYYVNETEATIWSTLKS
jgi:hypothetical protein